MCRLPHFIHNAYGLQKEAAAFVRQPPALSADGKPLARASKGHNVYRRERSAVKLGDVPHMDHIRKMPPGNGYALRHDLAGPQGAYAIKRGGIGKAAYAVKERGQCNRIMYCQMLCRLLLSIFVREHSPQSWQRYGKSACCSPIAANAG